jgi:8-oxo-dGTP pyrophosphatase MutT (NUDIX family)
VVYDSYNMNKKSVERKKTISCGTVVYKYGTDWQDTEILLVKQFSSNDGWGIPKGHINPNESFESCAIRETQEETGILVNLGQRLKNAKAFYKSEEKTVVSFLATQLCTGSVNFRGSESEVVDARWHKVDSLPRIYTYQQSIVEEALTILKSSFQTGDKTLANQ